MLLVHPCRRLHCWALCLMMVAMADCVAQEPDVGRTPAENSPRDPVSIALIQMDLTAAQSMLRKHDLDDDGSLNKTEWARLKWEDDEVRRFDVNRDGKLQHVELALKSADARLDDGIVQMDSTLADRYTAQYDSNRDGKLSLDELSQNGFTDAQESFDRNSDGELTQTELIRGLAFERKFRDELGIKGCDQGGAMKLINLGDMNRDKRIDESELEQAGLKPNAMDFDRNDNGKLSVSELAELLANRRHKMGLTPSDQLAARGMMRQMDRDGDGVIAAAEMPVIRGEQSTPKWDLNSDGMITELELETFFGDRRKELGFDDEDSDRATTLIQRNDSDGDRALSKSELVASGGDRNSPLAPAKLPLIDADRDGVINVQELARYLKKTR